MTTTLITGANKGLGFETARRLIAAGHTVYVGSRDAERGRRAAGQLGARMVLLDVTDDASVAAAAKTIEADGGLDVLVNNAGAMYTSRHLTPDGVELTWAVNHMAPFALTTMLLDLLMASAPARIITTSSAAHHGTQIPFDDLNADRSYGTMGYTRYGESKLANILFTAELARRLEGTRVTANCFHPGFVGTGLNHNNGGFMRVGMWIAQMFARRPDQGAETLVWLADSPEVSQISGAYFVDKQRVTPSVAAQDMDQARRLWQVSEAMLAAAAPRPMSS